MQATAAQLGPDATQAHASSKMPDPASVLDGMRQDLLQARQQEQADPPAHRNKASKKPAAKAKARTLALKRPAGSCSALRRPAASQAAVGSQKCQSSTPLKRPAQSAASELHAHKKQALLKVAPASLVARHSKGCSGCRYTAYCTPSCWRKRSVEVTF